MAEPLPSWNTHDVEELRRFSRIRLIVADLDGTLIPSELSQTIQELSSSLSHYRYNVTVTLATGRTLAGVNPLLDKLSLPSGAPLVLYNGSIVIRNGAFSIIERRTISLESLWRILKISSAHRVRTLAYFYTDPLFAPTDMYSHEFVLGWTSRCEPCREFNNMPVQWLSTYGNDYPLEPSSILIETSNDPEMAPVIESHLAEIPDISITRSSSLYIEIRPRGSNKGVALESVARSQNLSKDEILTLGDNDNDSEMLAWAGIGVSIAKASPSAVRNSDYICRHGVFEGAVEVLRLVKHAKHYFYRPPRKTHTGA